MSCIRRVAAPGGIFFFTVVTRGRLPVFTCEERVEALREAIRTVRERRPFVIDAMVVMPDHLHCIWRLPAGDGDHSARWREIKKRTGRALAPLLGVSSIWQHRCWDHLIRDEHDWRRHVDYVHYNPVRHGLAARAADWQWSSFSWAVARGWYEPGWGTTEPDDIRDIRFE